MSILIPKSQSGHFFAKFYQFTEVIIAGGGFTERITVFTSFSIFKNGPQKRSIVQSKGTNSQQVHEAII